jgi:hypothetical protein
MLIRQPISQGRRPDRSSYARFNGPQKRGDVSRVAGQGANSVLIFACTAAGIAAKFDEVMQIDSAV